MHIVKLSHSMGVSWNEGLLKCCKCAMVMALGENWGLSHDLGSSIYYHILSYTIIYYHILSYTIIYYHLLSYTFIYYHILSYTIIYYHILSFTIIYFHILSYTIMYYHVLSCTIMYYHLLSFTIIYYHLLSSTIIYFLFIIFYFSLYHFISYCSPTIAPLYLHSMGGLKRWSWPRSLSRTTRSRSDCSRWTQGKLRR